MRIALKNGVLRYEDAPKSGAPDPQKQVGDPRRRDYCGGIMFPHQLVDYGDEKKTMQEWASLIATRICRPQDLPDGLYTETEFFDKLETLVFEMYT